MTSSDDQRLTNEELQTLENILVKLSGPGADLPWPLFRFITEVTATPNVDLLVQDAEKRVLFAWRDDLFGMGWHIPGRIIRHREEIGHRIAAYACEESGCAVDVADRAIALGCGPIKVLERRGGL